MANLLDYLDWRGDLPLDRSPFNEVDNLILSELSYLDFTGLVPGPGEGSGVPLRQAAQAFFDRHPEGEDLELGVMISHQLPHMLRRLAETERFREMKLNCFVDQVDPERSEQFAALTLETGDKRLYCAFRGTDDTLAGWREDLELACSPQVPAQRKAVDYLKAVARQYPYRKLRLGGHSKGGNLAVYAGVFCPPLVQRRILAVWSNDGPGFHTDILGLPEHRRIEARICSIVPKSSIVGMLLEHEETYTVVDSDELGFWQHDGFSWQVMGDHFVTLPQMSEQARRGSLAVREWVHSLTVEERSRFADALFRVLTASGAETLTDLKEDSLRSIGPMVKAMKDLDKQTREGLLDFIQLLFKNNARMVLEDIQAQAERWKPAGRRPAARQENQ